MYTSCQKRQLVLSILDVPRNSSTEMNAVQLFTSLVSKVLVCVCVCVCVGVSVGVCVYLWVCGCGCMSVCVGVGVCV